MCREFPIVERLGGREAVLAILRGRGVEIGSVHTIRMWSSPRRRQIPGAAVVALMRYCDQQQISYNSDDFDLAATVQAAA